MNRLSRMTRSLFLRPTRNSRNLSETTTLINLSALPSLAMDQDQKNVAYGLEIVIGKVENVGVGEGGRVESVVLEGGRVIEAEAVVLALGPWSGKFEMLASIFRVSGLKAHSIGLKPKEADAITLPALFLSFYPAALIYVFVIILASGYAKFWYI